MKTTLYFGFICYLAATLLTPTAAAELGYIHAKKAKILAAPETGSTVITQAQRGDAVTIDVRQGRWLKVMLKDQTGWVSALLVKDKPPVETGSVLSNSDTDLQETARRRASATTSGAAARGLRGEERDRQSDTSIADFGAIRSLEQHRVNEDETMEFLEQGLNE